MNHIAKQMKIFFEFFKYGKYITYCIEGSLLVRPDCPDLGIIQGLWYRHREEILQSRLPYQLVQPPPLTTRYRLYTPRSKI